MADPALQQLLETLEAAAARKRFRAIDFFEPYPKQLQFFAMGQTKRERLLMAGNQLGKSEAGAVETAYHLTGQYPKDWVGRKFDHPVKGWAAGETSLVTRDVSQAKLCGAPGVENALGTGKIPKECFADAPSMARGVTDAYDTIQIKHYTNGEYDGVSTLSFKSYEQGRQKFQGATLDFVWCDEEPPIDIYTEALTRTNATGGFVFITFTPLLGMSEVVLRFLNEKSDDRGVVTMTIDDAKHISPEERAKIIASYPRYQVEARTRGIPMLGSGRIFPYTHESISEPILEYLPPHWVKLWGIDFGIAHPFAAALIAWDRDNDVIHLLHTVRVSDQLPLQHAVPLKRVGAMVPVAWPHDGNNRENATGEPLAAQYRKEGLKMLGVHATWPDGGISTEAGVMEMQQRMTTGKFKVAAHLSDWFEEFDLYHRKDGQIVKLKDDLLSATRIALMMRRFAQAVPLGPGRVKSRQNAELALDIDFDLS